MGILPGRLDDIAPYFDWGDLGFLLVILSIPTLSTVGLSLPIIGVIGGSQSIALVTAISAFAGLYRLRKPNQPAPKVLPAFEPVDESEVFDFGLRNHGPGTALYLQIEVIDEERQRTVYTSRPLERPVHLDEGEFIGFIFGGASDNRFHSIVQAESDEKLSGELGLYFSYQSPYGARVPHYMNGEMERADSNVLSELIENEDTPRRMDLSEIYENCAE